LFSTLFVVCGKANFTNLSRYGDYSERTYRRQYQKSFNFISFNAKTIADAIPSYREQVAAIDCSFIPKSGKTIWGVDSFYNGSTSKSEKGLEISVVSLVDVDACQGYTLSVQQTPFTDRTPLEQLKPKLKKSEVLASERVQAYLEHLKITRPFFPDAKQFTGLCDCQSRKESSLDFHFNVSLSALNIAKYDQLPAQSEDDAEPLSFSMETYKRLAFNQHLLERFISMLDFYLTLIKSHPNYQSLLQYGSLLE
jgi:hypothetical protein